MFGNPMNLRRVTMTIAVLAWAAFVLSAPAVAQTDKATTIFNNMISALGGKAFLDVREIQASGKIFVFKRDVAAGSDVFVDYIKFPDKDRFETGPYRIKPTYINNGDVGWKVELPKIEPQPAAEAKAFQAAFKTGFQYVARFVLTRLDVPLQHVGTEMISFKRNDVLEFRDSGNFFRLFVDQQTDLPTKMQVRRAGEAFMREEQFANWHDFQGIRTALFVIRLRDGEREREVRFDNVSYNPGFADSLFAPPAAR
jgi:hypothetical protein